MRDTKVLENFLKKNNKEIKKMSIFIWMRLLIFVH